MNLLKLKLAFMTILLFCAVLTTYSSELKYGISTIPAGLTDNANAVIRNEEITFQIIDPGHAVYKEHFALTILNKSADNLANFVEHYSKLYKIRNYKMVIYDANGKQIKKVKQSEFKDYSAIPDFVLFSDDRVIAYEPQINTYPYTVEYDIETDDYELINYPTWLPQSKFDIAIENASISLVVPKGFKFNYLSRNLTDSMETKEIGSDEQYKWSTHNLKALDYEPYNAGIEEIVPYVIMSPDKFEYEGFEGLGNSWKNYGDFYFKLINSPNKLSEKTISEIMTLTKNVTDKKQKIKLLYEYMQNRTRYVAVSIGIGGLKPFDASIVDKYGYGDCKALTNYLKTLLDEVGITSYYTQVLAGRDERDIETEFAYDQFNHIILCVPLEMDTLWLECTNQKKPFGFLGSFTSDRHVQLITPEGGKLVSTPTLKAENNMQIRKAEVSIDEYGNGQASIVTFFTGIQFDDRTGIFYSNADDQKKELYEDVDISNFQIQNWKYSMDKDTVPSITENLNIKLNNYTTSSGKRIFLPVNLMNKNHSTPPKVKKRKTSVYFRWPYVDIDTIVYHIPENFVPEFIPEPKEIISDFGEYKSRISVDGKKLIYIRKIKHNNGKFASSRYNDYLEFRKQILSADNVKVALIKKEN